MIRLGQLDEVGPMVDVIDVGHPQSYDALQVLHQGSDIDCVVPRPHDC